MEFMASAIVGALILLMTYALASEGLWGAALMFFDVLFGALIAFNFYEPLAKLLADSVPFLSGFADTLCLFAIFILATFLLRLTTETLGPAMVRFPAPIYHLGRWVFALGCSLILVAVCLLGFDTAPVHKKVFFVMDYKSMVPFGLGLERRWLGFFQHTTGQIFVTHVRGSMDPWRQYKDANVFDPKAQWLLYYQEKRPYGEGVIGEEPGAAPGGAGATAGGGAPPGMPGAPPAPPPGAGAGNANPADPKVIGPAVGGGVVVQ
jgi:hypothetical protein